MCEGWSKNWWISKKTRRSDVGLKWTNNTIHVATSNYINTGFFLNAARSPPFSVHECTSNQQALITLNSMIFTACGAQSCCGMPSEHQCAEFISKVIFNGPYNVNISLCAESKTLGLLKKWYTEPLKCCFTAESRKKSGSYCQDRKATGGWTKGLWSLSMKAIPSG